MCYTGGVSGMIKELCLAGSYKAEHEGEVRSRNTFGNFQHRGQ